MQLQAFRGPISSMVEPSLSQIILERSSFLALSGRVEAIAPRRFRGYRICGPSLQGTVSR
jgi:hypothetical protein